MLLVGPDDYENCFYGYHLQRCAVIDNNNLAFVMRNFEDTLKYDSLQEYSVRKKLSWYEVRTDEHLHGGGCVINESEELFVTAVPSCDAAAIFINMDGMAYIHDKNGIRKESNLASAINIQQENVYICTAKTIHNHVYVCGHRGLVACRTAQDKWINLSLDPATFPGPPLTLVDMDGFAPNDLYAVAMEAGVFHFDGSSWRRVPFPSNILLESVCCGEDGVVYVSGQAGTLFAGRGSRWREVHAGSFTLPYTDMIWHDNALWCTSDYGVWTFADNRLERAPVPDEVYFCSGHLSARDGLLLLGGMNGAAIHDGSRWQVLYFQPEIFEGMES